ncbi:MAG: hypothetical protein ABI443_04460 [Chthoniobacterales bacterium]
MKSLETAWKAARRNFVPAIFLQTLMIALLIAYFFHSPTQHVLNILGEWKQSFGYGFSFVTGAAAGGVLPEIIQVLFFQKGKILKRNFIHLLFGVIYWGCMGMIVDLFYRNQALWFGNTADLKTIALKVCVDMFIYSAFFACPVGVVLYRWRDRHFHFSAFREMLHPSFIRKNIFPTLVANWVVWIPIVCVIYAMPSALQLPVCMIAEAFWVLMFATMSELHSHRDISPIHSL